MRSAAGASLSAWARSAPPGPGPTVGVQKGKEARLRHRHGRIPLGSVWKEDPV